MSLPAPVPAMALQSFLDELREAGGVSLRGPDMFATLERGGDWDLLVPDLPAAEVMLVRHVGPPERVAFRSYVSSYFFSWGHIDLLPAWTWRGVTLLGNDDLLAARDLGRHSEFVALDAASEAIVVWLNGVLWGGVFNERYAVVVAEAVERDPGGLRTRLRLVVGRRWADRLWAMAEAGQPGAVTDSAEALRRHVLRRNILRRPVATVLGRVAFIRAELKLRRRPQVPWLSVTEQDLGDITEAVILLEPVVSGLRRYDWSSEPKSIRALARRLREYWGPVVQERARGRVVVVHEAVVPGRSFLAKVETRLRPHTDRGIGGDTALALESWLRRQLAERSAADVAGRSVMKIKGVMRCSSHS